MRLLLLLLAATLCGTIAHVEIEKIKAHVDAIGGINILHRINNHASEYISASPETFNVEGFPIFTHSSVGLESLSFTETNWTYHYPHANDVNHVCKNAVDYNFMLPDGKTEDELNNLAFTRLTYSSAIFLLPSNCQAIIKRIVCGLIYKDKTKSNGPCKSVVDELYNKQGACRGFPALLNLTASFDPAKFATTNCNTMSATFQVHESAEIYMAPSYWANQTGQTKYAGACQGIVSTNKIFIAPYVKDVIVPMAPPYKFQIMVEYALKGLVEALPVWMKQDCHFALKKYVCGNAFLEPSSASLKNIASKYNLFNVMRTTIIQNFGFSAGEADNLLNYTFQLPSPLSYSVCETYATSCAAFYPIVVAANPSANSTLTPPANCNKYQFKPILFATVQNVLPVHVVPTNMTNASDLAESGETWVPRCPKGFVIPDDPLDTETTWVPNSGCAVACKTPYWTDDEWAAWNGISGAMAIIGLPFVLLFIITWLSDAKRKKQYLVICFVTMSGTATLIFFIVHFIPFDQKFCRNNAVGLNSNDGPNICVAESIILQYTAVACCLAWLMQCIDLYIKLVVGKKYDWAWRLYIAIIFIGPVLPTASFGNMRIAGYGGRLPWCFVNLAAHKQGDVNDDVDAGLFYLPILIITVFGVLIMVRVMIFIAMTIGKSSISSTRVASGDEDSVRSNNSPSLGLSGKLRGQLNALRTPILFVSLFLVVWVTLFSFRGQNYVNQSKWQDSFIAWVGCIFKSFTSGNQDLAYEVCGRHAEERLSPSFAGWVMMCASGQSILVTIIFFSSPDVYRTWKMWITGENVSKRISSSWAGPSADGRLRSSYSIRGTSESQASSLEFNTSSNNAVAGETTEKIDITSTNHVSSPPKA